MVRAPDVYISVFRPTNYVGVIVTERKMNLSCFTNPLFITSEKFSMHSALPETGFNLTAAVDITLVFHRQGQVSQIIQSDS